MKKNDKELSRRSFIGRTIASLAGVGLGLSAAKGLRAQETAAPSAQPGAPAAKPAIREYRDLGRTGWKTSDLGFGNAMIQDTSLVEYAMERGINYIDTARQYYEMEVVLGKLDPAKRAKLFIATKLLPELFTAKTTAAEITTAIEESLKRLNTSCLDCVEIHSIGEDPKLSDPAKIKNPAIVEAFEKAKKDGKIRFWGATSHGPRMVEDFDWLVDNTPIDMIQPGMNFMTKGLGPVLAKAKAKGIAVVAMKSLAEARKINYKPFMKNGATVRQAVIKWTLAQPNIDCIAMTMRSVEMIDEYIAASGRPELTPEEEKALKGYGALLDRDYCRPGCSGCLAACPNGVPIADILRYRLYFGSYGEEKHAMSLYRKLPRERSAERCASCEGPCEATCPHNLAIRSKLLAAHGELTV
ncbi:MAG: aldo/keto reductase [Candidatus Krumholzibacteria bacterium]|nr:aldo/keto reductase [Candidatus Krumholzibacteria bacterium]